MVVQPGPCRNDGTCTAHVVLVLNLDDAMLLHQVGCNVSCRSFTPPTTEGKWRMDKIQVEVAEQPCVIGLDDPINLHHDAVGCQLLWHHEQQPDLVVNGLRGDGESHAVVWLE